MKIKALILVMLLGLGGTFSTPSLAGADPYLGEIMWVGYTYCPRGWAEANGQLLAISSYSALYALYGTTYGGDGRTTFALPDLRGRSMVHTGTGAGLTPKTMGQRSGNETTTLSASNLPSHTHTMRANPGRADSVNPANGLVASPGRTRIYSDASSTTNLNSAAISHTGASQSFSNRDPYLVMRACVALTGIFPPRT